MGRAMKMCTRGLWFGVSAVDIVCRMRVRERDENGRGGRYK